MEYLTVVPAYGRDYKSKAAAVADWNAGKDFRIAQFGHVDDGRYVNKPDLNGSGVSVSIRYNQLTRVAVVKP
jgi:hypothetical protein